MAPKFSDIPRVFIGNIPKLGNIALIREPLHPTYIWDTFRVFFFEFGKFWIFSIFCYEFKNQKCESIFLFILWSVCDQSLICL